MGKADQLAKRILSEETQGSTQGHVSFEVPREVPVGALQPDGVLQVIVADAGFSALPAPWNRLRREASLDVKMPGDHMDYPALARAELRRCARWVQHLETDPAPVDPAPGDFATWVVAPHLPRWLRKDADKGTLTLKNVGLGCWQVGPRDHDVLWIAANELPLRVELIPLLVARSGRALVDFLVWAAEVKSPAWVADVIKHLPVDPNLADDYRPIPDDPELQLRVKAKLFRKIIEQSPEVANEIRQEGVLEGRAEGVLEGRAEGVLEGRAEGVLEGRAEGVLEGRAEGVAPLLRLFERKLSRPLAELEHKELVRRLGVVGPDRLGDVVLDLTPEDLGAWLADPNAK